MDVNVTVLGQIIVAVVIVAAVWYGFRRSR